MRSIRNLDLILTITIGYVAELSGKSYDAKLYAEIIEKFKRLFGNLILFITQSLTEFLKFNGR